MAARAIVVPYDSEWPRRFEKERALLERALAPWLSGGIHHIGSTAIPGIAAKPEIDMMAGVRDLQEARAAFEPLFALGYEETPHRPRTHHFSKPAGGPWTHQLHLIEPGSDLWVERLAFRDALRADPALVAEYQALKLQMIEEERRGGPGYSAVTKRPFVARVLAQAGIEIPPVSPRRA